MSLRFTIVPQDLLPAARDFLRWVALDPAVVMLVEDVTEVFFAGSREVASEAPRGHGLACIRILGSGVFHVDLDGYEASVEHASRYVRMALATFPCRVFDDETGEDLTLAAKENPEILFAVS